MPRNFICSICGRRYAVEWAKKNCTRDRTTIQTSGGEVDPSVITWECTYELDGDVITVIPLGGGDSVSGTLVGRQLSLTDPGFEAVFLFRRI